MSRNSPSVCALAARAADWNLGSPDWTGRLKLTSRGRTCNIRLEDRNSGELFANCPVETYPGVAIEAVTDSSRYFVLRIMDDSGESPARKGRVVSDRCLGQWMVQLVGLLQHQRAHLVV